jgi:BMFP domain-containing protein YqiC
MSDIDLEIQLEQLQEHFLDKDNGDVEDFDFHAAITMRRAIKEITTLRQQVAELEARLSAYREALEKIARRGTVFDAKGTWSAEVHKIASQALTGGGE